jgi:hypothetical protein
VPVVNQRSMGPYQTSRYSIPSGFVDCISLQLVVLISFGESGKSCPWHGKGATRVRPTQTRLASGACAMGR